MNQRDFPINSTIYKNGLLRRLNLARDVLAKGGTLIKASEASGIPARTLDIDLWNTLGSKRA